jgi:hypothetical protein
LTSNHENFSNDRMPVFRSCLMRLVLLSFVLLSGFGWLRMVQAIRDWNWLSFAAVEPGPLYLAISGGLWGAAGLLAVIVIWLWRPWSSLVGLGVALFYALTFWADRLIFSRAPGSQANAPFALLMTILCLGIVLLALRPFEELRRLVASNQTRAEEDKSSVGKRSGQY